MIRFKRPFLVYPFIIFVLAIFVFITFRIFSKKNRMDNSSSFFSTRCIDYKQRDFSRKLTDKIVDYLPAAKLCGIKICKDDDELHRNISEGKLIKVSSGSSYVVEKMSFSYPCVTRNSKALLDEIARRLTEKSDQKGLKGVKFYITSMTRKTENVRNLRRFNGNASEHSPHLYGNAFDISYKRFIARKWVLTNCDKKFLKEALAEVIWQLKSENRCWATYEKMQSCFHVVSR